MNILRMILHQWRITPLRGHLLSIMEGLLLSSALQLYASEWRLPGVIVGVVALFLSYLDGSCGWSTSRS